MQSVRSPNSHLINVILSFLHIAIETSTYYGPGIFILSSTTINISQFKELMACRYLVHVCVCVCVCVCARLVIQSCLTLCNPMDCSLPGSSLHGIFLARIVEKVAISYSKGSSRPKH